MNNSLFLALAFFLVRSCAQAPRTTTPVARDTTISTSPSDSLPLCLRQRIEEISRQPVWSPPAEISEYVYKGRTVFLLTADCCDQFTTLTDQNCNTLCAPTGGFTGHGDGKCPDFRDSARLVRLVWKDER